MELATGNKHKEEWTFLPRNWRNPVYRKQIFFNKNFALFGFLPWYTYPRGTGDILLLNMASRKKFWMERRKIENQIRPIITSISDSLYITHSRVRWMKVGVNGIEIKLDSQMNWSMDNFLG